MATKAKGKPDAANPNTNTLTVLAKPGDTESVTIARTLLRPCVQAASTLKKYTEWMVGADLTGLVEELDAQAKAANDGDLKRPEGMLMIQAHTLDAIFNSLAQRAALNMGEYLDAADRYMRLALKAQSQCRATLETLAAVKNPPPVAFVRQANIGYNQQVNNSMSPPAGASRARETEIRQNELLEVRHGERLDTATTRPASGNDPQLATVGGGDRAAHGRG